MNPGRQAADRGSNTSFFATHVGKPGWSSGSWIQPGCCGYLGNEIAHGKSLSASLPFRSDFALQVDENT